MLTNANNLTMKQSTIFAILTAACALATSCDKEAGKPQPSTKMEIKITANAGTRATDSGFESGDRVGLYVVNYKGANPGTLAATGNHVDNMSFTYSGSWTPTSPIYWLDQTTHADFYLYYPYAQVTNPTAHPFSVAANQSTRANYTGSDFMTGKAANVAPTTNATVINADHRMSRAVIELKAGNGFTTESLANANIAVKLNGIKCNTTVNIANGTVSDPTGDPVSITPLFEENSYKAIVVPQSVAEGNLITVTVDGRDFNLKKAFTFVGGQSHKFTVTLSKTSNGVNVNINPWGNDGTDNGGTAE